MGAEVLVVLGLLAFLVLPLVLSLVATSRSRRVERELLELQGAVSSLRERLYDLRKEGKPPAPVPIREPVVMPRAEPAAPPPRDEALERKPPVAPPVAPPIALPIVPPDLPPPPRETPSPISALASPAKSWRPSAASIDWEGFIGVRLFSWIAGVFLVIGGVFFLKYSIERGWLGAPVRMALGLVVGTGLLAVCEWKAARRYAVTANALDGAGIAILFSTIFASSALWHLLGIVPAFLLMALVAAVAVALSIRRDSLFIALLGLIGGFATPVLLSTGEDRPFGLFGYLLLLNAGLAWLAHRKRWAFLSILSLVFTTFYQWGWVAKFLTREKLPLAAGIFLVFPVFSAVALFFFSKEREKASDPVFGLTAAASAALPLLFALFMATVPAYGPHWALLFGFLLLVAAGLAALAAARGPEELHVLGGVATLAVFGIWIVRTAGRPSPVAVIAILTPFVLGYLFAGRIAALAGRPYGRTGAEVAYAAPILLFVFPVLVAIDPASAAPAPLFGPLLALAAIVAVVARLEKKPSLHVVAAVFVVATEVLWLELRLRPESLLGGLAVFAVFGLFYMAVPAAAKRRVEASGEPVPVRALALSGAVLLIGVAMQPALTTPPWPLLGILALLTLAGTLTGIYLGESTLEGAVLGISQVVLLAFEYGSREIPGPQVAVVSAIVVGLWGAALFSLSRLKERAVPALVGLFLSQAVAIVATPLPGAPPAGVLLAAHVMAVASVLAIAWRTGWHVIAVIAAATSALAAFVFQASGDPGSHPQKDLLFAGVLFGLLLAYPLLLGKRAGKEREPYLAAVLSSVAFFFLARRSFLEAGWNDVIGLLPVGEAVLLAVLLLGLLRLGVPPDEDATRLALVAGAILAFVTAAIPLQLENEWITIGWALLATSLVWLHTRIPHGGLVVTSAGLYAAVFVRLAFNPAVLTYHPRAATPIWNWYLYTYLVPAAAAFLGTWLLLRPRGTPSSSVRPLLDGLRWSLPAGGTVLLFLLLNIEIADFYSTGPTPTFRFLSAVLAEGLSYTLGWAVFAVGLLVAGIVLRVRSARIAAVALLLVTVFKCFLFDLARLGGLYRVGSFMGLAVSLAAVALLLQKFVLKSQREDA